MKQPSTGDLIKALRAMCQGGISDPLGTTVLVIGQAADKLEEQKKKLDKVASGLRGLKVSAETSDMFPAPASPIVALDQAECALWYLNERLKKQSSKYRGFKPSKTNLKHLNARIKDGYTIEDFKVVIDGQIEKWIGTEQQEYLRPSTLFNSEKFEGYLNATTMPKVTCHKVLPNQVKGYKHPEQRSTRDLSMREQLGDTSWAD